MCEGSAKARSSLPAQRAIRSSSQGRRPWSTGSHAASPNGATVPFVVRSTNGMAGPSALDSGAGRVTRGVAPGWVNEWPVGPKEGQLQQRAIALANHEPRPISPNNSPLPAQRATHSSSQGRRPWSTDTVISKPQRGDRSIRGTTNERNGRAFSPRVRGGPRHQGRCPWLGERMARWAERGPTPSQRGSTGWPALGPTGVPTASEVNPERTYDKKTSRGKATR